MSRNDRIYHLTKEDESMSDIKTLGIDLAKNIFQLCGVNEAGKIVLTKRLKRKDFSAFIANLPPCLIGMEACGGANYWARKFQTFGHTVKLIAPQFVKPYVKSNKNDQRDAEAICEAVTRPTMRFVPIKQVEHQDMQMLHRIRSQAIKQRTALSNQIRGFLAEYGLVIPKGLSHIRKNLPNILEDAENELTANARELFSEQYEEFKKLDKRVKLYDSKIDEAAKRHEACQRLMEVEGIGPLTATILWSTITDPSLFKNGRGVAAFLGLVPKQRSSGNKTVLLGISKRGDRYLRMLLIHGGRTVIKYAHQQKTKRQRLIANKVERSGINRTAVAVANKNARIAWALLSRGEVYRSGDSLGVVGLPQGTQVECA